MSLRNGYCSKEQRFSDTGHFSPRRGIIHHPIHWWSLGLIHETRLRKCSNNWTNRRGKYESYANKQSIQILRNLQSTEWVQHQKIASTGCDYGEVLKSWSGHPSSDLAFSALPGRSCYLPSCQISSHRDHQGYHHLHLTLLSQQLVFWQGRLHCR